MEGVSPLLFELELEQPAVTRTKAREEARE
jgi:hypothetical protein